MSDSLHPANCSGKDSKESTQWMYCRVWTQIGKEIHILNVSLSFWHLNMAGNAVVQSCSSPATYCSNGSDFCMV